MRYYYLLNSIILGKLVPILINVYETEEIKKIIVIDVAVVVQNNNFFCLRRINSSAVNRAFICIKHKSFMPGRRTNVSLRLNKSYKRVMLF